MQFSNQDVMDRVKEENPTSFGSSFVHCDIFTEGFFPSFLPFIACEERQDSENKADVSDCPKVQIQLQIYKKSLPSSSLLITPFHSLLPDTKCHPFPLHVRYGQTFLQGTLMLEKLYERFSPIQKVNWQLRTGKVYKCQETAFINCNFS